MYRRKDCMYRRKEGGGVISASVDDDDSRIRTSRVILFVFEPR